MRKERKEIIRKEYEEIYIAEDGTEFASEGECKKYEDTAEFVINNKIEKMRVGNKIGNIGEQHWQWGCEDTLFCVNIKNEDDLHDVNMWVAYHSVYACGPIRNKYNPSGKFQFDSDAIGTIQVFNDCYGDYYAYGDVGGFKKYLHEDVDELFDEMFADLSKKKESKEEA